MVSRLRRIGAGGSAADRLMGSALKTPVLDVELAVLDELKRESTLLGKLDPAWRTTAIAADVMTELEITQAMQEATVGKLAISRLQLLIDALTELKSAGKPMPSVDKGLGLRFSPAACTAGPRAKKPKK